MFDFTLTDSGRIETRLPEFVKRLYPEVLRNRVRNLKRFIVSVATEKRTSLSLRKHTEATSSARATAEGLRQSAPAVIECDDDEAKTIASEYLAAPAMDLSVPDVVVQEENATSESRVDGLAEPQTTTASNLQLAVDVEATPRNKSPVTVQEWVDSLPLNLSETSK